MYPTAYSAGSAVDRTLDSLGRQVTPVLQQTARDVEERTVRSLQSIGDILSPRGGMATSSVAGGTLAPRSPPAFLATPPGGVLRAPETMRVTPAATMTTAVATTRAAEARRARAATPGSVERVPDFAINTLVDFARQRPAAVDLLDAAKAESRAAGIPLADRYPAAELLRGGPLVIRLPEDEAQNEIAFWSLIMAEHMDFVHEMGGHRHHDQDAMEGDAWAHRQRHEILASAQNLAGIWRLCAAQAARQVEPSALQLDRIAQLVGITAYVKVYVLLFLRAVSPLGDFPEPLAVEIAMELGYFVARLADGVAPVDDVRFWAAHGFDHASLEAALLSPEERAFVRYAHAVADGFDQAGALGARDPWESALATTEATEAYESLMAREQAADGASVGDLHVRTRAPPGLLGHTRRELDYGLARIREALDRLSHNHPTGEEAARRRRTTTTHPGLGHYVGDEDGPHGYDANDDGDNEEGEGHELRGMTPKMTHHHHRGTILPFSWGRSEESPAGLFDDLLESES